MTGRGRRTARPSGDDRQEAILATTQALLADRDFESLSVAELAAGAGISRPTFYFYFPSKDEVLLSLLDRVIRQVEDQVADLPREFAAAPQATWRQILGAFVEGFTHHHPVAMAAMAARPRSAAIAELWSRSMRTWIDFTAEVIDSERARGAAPTGIAAHHLAVALNLMNEQVLLARGTGDHPLEPVAALVDLLTTIWVRSIYATQDPGEPIPARRG